MKSINILTALVVSYSSCVAFDELQLGLVGFTSSNPYRSVSSETHLLPFIKANYGMVYIEGLDAGVNAWQNEHVAIKAGISLGTYGYKSKDGSYLHGMKTKHASLDADVKTTITLDDSSTIIAQFNPDISNKHNGYSVSIQYDRIFFKKDAHNLSGFIRGEYLNDKKADYYFGVSQAESTIARNAYDVGDAFNPSIGLNYTYAISEKWTILGGVNYVYLDKNIHKSPIIDDREDVLAYAGFMYRFF